MDHLLSEASFPCEGGDYLQQGSAAVGQKVRRKPSAGAGWADMRTETPDGNGDDV